MLDYWEKVGACRNCRNIVCPKVKGASTTPILASRSPQSMCLIILNHTHGILALRHLCGMHAPSDTFAPSREGTLRVGPWTVPQTQRHIHTIYY